MNNFYAKPLNRMPISPLHWIDIYIYVI